ncbi:hypothetical protein AB1Y20_008725 [Prymnesium parvum]|uniref:Uncharacterized protein n=1 Tax=Prymnesium parvum TaxID=97485 RepID=A0AB34IU98_PRYPA
MAALVLLHSTGALLRTPACHYAPFRPASATMADIAAPSLVGSHYTLQLDIGVERGTWMPPSWGRSGARATPKLRVVFEEEGKLRITETGAYDARIVKWEGTGGWEYDAGRETVQFWLSHSGVAQDDVVLGQGKLWFSAPAWGNQLSRRGNLTIRQSKLGWLPFLPTLPGVQGSFMVGTFRTEMVSEDAPPLGM